MGKRGARRDGREELGRAAEVTALSAMAFGRPILDTYGDHPFAFAARGVSKWDVVAYGVLVLALPALVVVTLGLASHWAGQKVRDRTHVALVVLLGGITAWWLAFQHTPLEDSGIGLVVVTLGLGAGLGWLRVWPRTRPTAAVFLRYAGIAPIVLLAFFLFASPTSSWFLFPSSADLTAAEHAAEQVSADLGEDPPPVVMVVLDALPTATLLDGSGQINSEHFPNIARFTDDSTWYRNHSTVSLFTQEAIPSLTTGRYRRGDDETDPENIFTLLGSRYDIHAEEQLTGLCQTAACHSSRSPFGGLSAVLGDARRFWLNTFTRHQTTVNDVVPQLQRDHFAESAGWFERIEPQDEESSARPPFHFYHVMLPHSPWQHTQDGTLYESIQEPALGTQYLGWGSSGAAVGRQRHLLQAQATDQLLGILFDRLQEVELYDDALIVLVADHGRAFLPNQNGRGLAEGNEHHVAWAPLMIKTPGQSRGEVNDDNLMNIDIVPTMAEVLGLELPWEVDGLPASQVAGERDPDVKVVLDNEFNWLRPENGQSFVHVDASDGFQLLLEEEGVEGSGPDAVWQRTQHGDLLRERIDRLDVREGPEPPDDAGELDVMTPRPFSDIDTGDPLPLEILGKTDLPPETVVAYGVNGRIAALTEVEQAPDHNWAHALLHPSLFTDGENHLDAYVVEGPPGSETLHPVDVRL